MDIATRLAAAHAEAQRCFHAMLLAHYPDPRDPDRLVPAYSLPDAPETKAYVAAERVVDELLVLAQWEKAKTELDAAIASDHFAGMP